MSLKDTINNDIKNAMRSKEREKLEALRAVKSAILLAETEKGAGEDLGEEREVALLQKLVKQRKESAEMYTQQGREDMAADELAQAAVIEVYLPEQMSEDEIRSQVKTIIEQTGASQPSEMGKVMGPAMASMKGKADGKLISAIVKELLS